jgi:hypothetical protein
MAEESVSTFVQRRGATKQRSAFGVGGAVGAAINTGSKGDGANSDQVDPGELLGSQGLGHFAVENTEVVISKAKGGLKHKATEEVLIRVPRDTVKAASFDGKMLMGILAVDFVDGSRWEFDVPRQYKKSATEVAQVLNG